MSTVPSISPIASLMMQIDTLDTELSKCIKRFEELFADIRIAVTVAFPYGPQPAFLGWCKFNSVWRVSYERAGDLMPLASAPRDVRLRGVADGLSALYRHCETALAEYVQERQQALAAFAVLEATLRSELP